MIYPADFEGKIEFNKIRERLKEFCLGDLGIGQVNDMSFMSVYESIRFQLDITDEFRNMLFIEEPFPSENYHNVLPFFAKIKVEGTFLEVHQVAELKYSLETIRSIVRYIKKLDKEKYPALTELAKDIKWFPFVLEFIDSVITKYGKIKDNASPGLAKIRKDIQKKQAAVSKRMQVIFKKARDAGIVPQDAEVSLREGRPVIPVISSDKRQVRGFIHDESATGKTVFIEPAEIVEMNNDIRELQHAERREITKILVQLANEIRPYIPDLTGSYEFLGIIDFIRAKALFALDIEAAKPVFLNTRAMRWKGAKHPLLYMSYRHDNKAVVPLDIALNDENRIIIISGPNAGGKSVCLKTVGLLQYMMQCGMLVPMSENSETGMYENLFIDIGDEQSLENDLSTYSSHLLNMKFFAKSADARTMILIDEFGTGTEPLIGGSIAEALLDRFNKKNTYGVITTHYANLKHFAAAEPGLINGAMLFDTRRIQPVYKLETGKPGSSFAIDIARKIGLPEDILQQASEKAGKNHFQFDKHLREITRDKRYWENKRSRIRQAEKKLEELTDNYSGELQDIKKIRSETLEKARQEAEKIVKEANREFEKTIRIIRESQADKEKTKEARRSFDQYKGEITKKDLKEDENIERKIKKIRERKEKKKPVGKKSREKREEEDKSARSYTGLCVGDKVRLYGQNMVGEVLDINGQNIMAAFGSMVTTVKETRLEKISEKGFKRQKIKGTGPDAAKHLSERKLNFKPDIDLRGKRADEALALVQRFIDEAVMVGSGEVRILHGKGNGILRQLIRDYLGTVDVVRTFRDEHVEQGGAGITVVDFEY